MNNAVSEALPVVKRREIYWVDWPARGSGQAGRRPALIVRTDAVSTSGCTIATHVSLTPSAPPPREAVLPA